MSIEIKMLKEIKNKELINNVLNSLQIIDSRDKLEAFEIVIASLATLMKSIGLSSISDLIKLIDFTPISSLKNLSQREISELEELVTLKIKTITHEDILKIQYKVATLMDPIQRKKLAAYYTKPIGLKIMEKLVDSYIETQDQPLTLADPFLGSGLTLSETIKELPISFIDKVWGVEHYPLSALVAYSAITYSLKGKYEKVKVIVGDIFKIAYKNLQLFVEPMHEIFPKADVILTNPPFTRWEILSKDYRDFLTKFINLLGYSKFVEKRQQNLQLISLFLIDYFLKKEGLLISVLPASTFYTLYGEAAKALLKEKYQLNMLLELSSEASFSTDSGFKELIVVASKRNTNFDTAFITIDANEIDQLDILSRIVKGEKPIKEYINWVNVFKIPYPWNMNWLALFGQNSLRELISEIFAKAKGILDTWQNVFSEKIIIRGIEIYGPDFFFIPNKYWKIVNEDAKGLLIESNNGLKLLINREFLVPTLRKPELYVDTIIPRIEHYFISIPPKDLSELPHDLVEYIKWGQLHSTAKPAIKAFGHHWYSHVYKQINVKKPFGHIFLPDKIDPSFAKRGIFACYSKFPLTASKNFYIVNFNDELKDKALTLWFNSSLFIAYFIVGSRKISERWSRFLEEDYLRMPVINVNLLDKNALLKLARSLDKMSKIKLEPVILQLNKDYRFEMDKTLLEIIGIEDSAILQKLYSLLKSALLQKNNSSKQYAWF
jgi:hypothetical protein